MASLPGEMVSEQITASRICFGKATRICLEANAPEQRKAFLPTLARCSPGACHHWIFLWKLKEKLSLNYLRNVHCLMKTIILHVLLKMRQDGCQQSRFWKSCKKLALPHVKLCELHMGKMAKATFFPQLAWSLHKVDARLVAGLWISVASGIWDILCRYDIHLEIGVWKRQESGRFWTKLLDPEFSFSQLLHGSLLCRAVCMVESWRATSITLGVTILDIQLLDEGESASQTHREKCELWRSLR